MGIHLESQPHSTKELCVRKKEEEEEVKIADVFSLNCRGSTNIFRKYT
jgi:hypothetical protein